MKRQGGASLFITVIGLVIVSLLAIVAIRFSTVNLRIAGNTQVAAESEAAAKVAIDRMIGDINNFRNPPTVQTSRTVSIGGKPYGVTLDVPYCVDNRLVSGYTAVVRPGGPSPTPVDQVWDFHATFSEASSGDQVDVHQGVKIRMPPGSLCP